MKLNNNGGKKIEKNEYIFRQCPNCKFISGFCLTKDEIKKNEKYFCQECQRENKLSEHGKSSEYDYKFQEQALKFFKSQKYDKELLLSKL